MRILNIFLIFLIASTSYTFAQRGRDYRRPFPPEQDMVRLAVYPENITMYEGDFVQFTAVAFTREDCAFTPSDIQWSINEGNISQSGYFTAPEDQSFTYHPFPHGQQPYKQYRITARVRRLTATVNVTVRPKQNYHQVTRIQVYPTNGSVAGGQTLQFTATCYNSQNQPVNCNVKWTAQGGDIDNDGLFRATGRPGTYQVVATDPQTGIQGFANFQVTQSFKPFPGHPIPRPVPVPRPFPMPTDNPRIVIEKADIGGGNFFSPKVKVELQVFGRNVQVLRVYAVTESGVYNELCARSCKDGDKISINERYDRLTSDRLEFRLYDNNNNVIATESRPAK
ncbi:MAG TPA: Ig-like domain-containing protein [Planctomycetota bacterium]|nr:Ig-like domain-containing protein [Planctomycetota bacterium]HRU52014.1 Ig-like domain-containing protein [Planctomycetota bacterium]